MGGIKHPCWKATETGETKDAIFDRLGRQAYSLTEAFEICARVQAGDRLRG